MLDFILQRWRHLLAAVITLDLLVVGAGYYFFVVTDTFAGPPVIFAALPNTPTPRPTPWAGPPGGKATTTPILPPTPLATTVLAQSGFPLGFTPTPRPTREPVYIKLPDVYIGGRNYLDVPSINQVLYPEPFFAHGTNNACGPVALFAGLLGLGLNIDYSRVRDLAVSYGFGPEGISKSGMINTVATVNQEMGNPFTVEHGSNYRTKDLIKNLSQGAVVVVLLRVKRVNGQFQVTTDREGSIGHFLLVERINIRSKSVRFAGSTLGMEQVGLGEFVASWASNPQAVSPASGWRAYLNNEQPKSWALILKPVK